MQKSYITTILFLIIMAPVIAVAQTSLIDKYGWVLCSDNPNEKGALRYININSYALAGYKSFTYWEKAALPKPVNEGGMVFDEILALTEFDCNQNRSRKLEVVMKLHGSIINDSNKVQEWEYHDPDSMHDSLHEGLCKKAFSAANEK